MHSTCCVRSRVDKASVEITSLYEGVVRELLVQEGEIAKVGAGLCLIEVTEEDSSSVSEEPAVAALASSPNTSDERPLAVNLVRMHYPMNPQYASENAGASSKDVLATPSVRHLRARMLSISLCWCLAPGRLDAWRNETSKPSWLMLRPTLMRLKEPSWIVM